MSLSKRLSGSHIGFFVCGLSEYQIQNGRLAAILYFLLVSGPLTVVSFHYQLQFSVAHYLSLWLEASCFWRKSSCDPLVAYCCPTHRGGGFLAYHWSAILFHNIASDCLYGGLLAALRPVHLHMHSRLNSWHHRIGQILLQDETRMI